jgi:transcriptional regulator
MYIRKEHQLQDPEAVFALMTAHPLGAWVCLGDQELIANPIPFWLDRSRGPLGTLVGHVSRANPVWRELAEPRASVVMFQGPQAYITPNWYPSHAGDGRVVPTWNYATAHAHGQAHAFDDRDRLLALLNQLTAAHEASQAKPWQLADMPASFLADLLRGIVGIEIPIDRLEGKLKASQDEALPDRHGTVAGLRQQPGDDARAMAALVQRALDAEGH